MSAEPGPPLIVIAGLGAPRAARATRAEEARRDAFMATHADSQFCTLAGSHIGSVRIGRGGYTAVADTLDQVLGKLEEFTAALADDSRARIPPRPGAG